MTPRLPEAFLQRPIAHRGLHDIAAGRPENSRSAFAAAIDHGYGIELDVQLTADDKAMVFHDATLERLTEATGDVRSITAAALGAIPLKGGSEPIPDLETVLDQVAGQVPLLVEIKDQDGAMGPNVGPLEQAVAKALADYDGPVAVMSFNPHAMAVMVELLPDVPRGLVTSAFDPEVWPLPADVCATLREITDYDRVGASFISHEASDLDRPRVHDLRQQGAQILCWTIRTPADDAKARRFAQNVTFEGYLPAVNG